MGKFRGQAARNRIAEIDAATFLLLGKKDPEKMRAHGMDWDGRTYKSQYRMYALGNGKVGEISFGPSPKLRMFGYHDRKLISEKNYDNLDMAQSAATYEFYPSRGQ